MPELHILRVFTGAGGDGGNPLGVFLDGHPRDPAERQRVAAALGFSETVFIDDPAAGQLQIFTPATELHFAGHPLVGAAWLLARRGRSVEVLRPPAGDVPARVDGERAFVAGDPDWASAYEWVELDTPAAVDALDGPPGGHELGAAYAWIDEPAGVLRARVFPIALGIQEDEATGGAAVRLGALLGRDLEIRQGRGSLIAVHPREDGLIEIGGGVALDEARAFDL